MPIWGDDPDTEIKDGFYDNDLITIGIYNNSEEENILESLTILQDHYLLIISFFQ